jgi:hypothetical protein
MRSVCRICRKTVTENRTAHLRSHGIDASFKGAVKEYFLAPEEA